MSVFRDVYGAFVVLAASLSGYLVGRGEEEEEKKNRTDLEMCAESWRLTVRKLETNGTLTSTVLRTSGFL